MDRCQRSSTSTLDGDVLALVLFNRFLDAITAATLSQHAGFGIKMLFNCGDSLVGSRKKMREKVSVQNMEYADEHDTTDE